MTRQEIIDTIAERVNAILVTTETLDEAAFFQMPHAEKWSVAQNLQHLILAAKPIVGALGSREKLAPFGQATHASRSYEAIKAAYLDILSRPLPPPFGGFRHVDTEGSMADVKTTFLSVHNRLNERLASFSEAELDAYQLPHPVAGMLTLREMLHFTAYHIEHHHKAIQTIVNQHV